MRFLKIEKSSPRFHDLGANADSKENASQLIETQMVSFFGRLNYKFNERYLFQASLRADGSSVFAKGHSSIITGNSEKQSAVNRCEENT